MNMKSFKKKNCILNRNHNIDKNKIAIRLFSKILQPYFLLIKKLALLSRFDSILALFWIEEEMNQKIFVLKLPEGQTCIQYESKIKWNPL